MCLICVEYFYQRMTKDELRNALPEMVMFAKNEEERNHFKKLQSLGNSDGSSEVDSSALDEEVAKHVSKNEVKNDYKASFRYSKTKTR